MATLIDKRAARAGLAPGTLRTDKAPAPEILAFLCRGPEFTGLSLEQALAARAAPVADNAWLWIHVRGAADPALLETLGQAFALHPLVLEDIQNTDQRPKQEDYDAYLFMVLRALRFNESQERVESRQFSLVLGDAFVLSFQEGERDLIGPLVERAKNTRSRLRSMGTGYLAYSLIDLIVDHYFVVLEQLWGKIELLEGRLVKHPTPQGMLAVQKLKRSLILLRRTVWPMRELVGQLEHVGQDFFEKASLVYLRDVYDHCNHAADTIDTFRELVSGMLDLYLSSVNNRTNEVMKVLTIIATIFIPLTFITGVFGMNFKDMPILGYRWAFPVTMLAMLVLALGMLAYFRRRNWL